MTPSPLHVAVVDDDQSVRRSFSRLLRAAGMRAFPYGSAEAFLTDTGQPPFDCLVLDVRLGGMSGIELAHCLAATGGGAPVIFVTGYDDRETRARAARAGCSAYFRKTDCGASVLDAIRRVSGRCTGPG
jgi:FixJ family two-component response regulator